MSRSYKKNPTIIGRLKAAHHKRLANKKIRKEEEIPDGMFYRKYYNSKNLKDFISRLTLDSLLKAYPTDLHLQDRFKSKEELITYWKLNYVGEVSKEI